MTSSSPTARRHLARLLVGLSAVALVCWPLNGAGASCAGPWLEVAGASERPALTRGADVTVNGRAFVDGCDDTGGGSTFGCSSQESEETPLTEVTLSVRQDGEVWELETEDAGLAADNELGQITWHATLPGDLQPGPAVLVTEQARLPITIKP